MITMQEIWKLDISLNCVEFNKNGNVLACGGKNGDIYLFKTEFKDEINVFPGKDLILKVVCFDKDHNLIKTS